MSEEIYCEECHQEIYADEERYLIDNDPEISVSYYHPSCYLKSNIDKIKVEIKLKEANDE